MSSIIHWPTDRISSQCREQRRRKKKVNRYWIASISSSILSMMTCHFYFTFFSLLHSVLRWYFYYHSDSSISFCMCGRCLKATATDVADDEQRRLTHTADTRHNNNRQRRRHTFHVNFEYIAPLASICKTHSVEESRDDNVTFNTRRTSYAQVNRIHEWDTWR